MNNLVHTAGCRSGLNGDLLGVAKAPPVGKAYLCGSVPVQKSSVKPRVSRPRERSQCGWATIRNVGADRRYSWGRRSGLDAARVSPAKTKRKWVAFGPLLSGFRLFTPVCISGVTCLHQEKTEVHSTIEVPRRLWSSRTRVTVSYKVLLKWMHHAAVNGTGFSRPVIQGCQLNQSSSSSPSPRRVKGSSISNRFCQKQGSYAKLVEMLKPHTAQGAPLGSLLICVLSNWWQFPTFRRHLWFITLRESEMIIKAHSLIGRITTDLMLEAFKAVKRNRGAAGVDKVSIDMFNANLMDNLQALMRELKAGTFQPLPLRRVYIPKNREQTEFRPLGIPVVRDRVAQEVVRRLLDPVFTPSFHNASFGFMKGRNAHMAIELAMKHHDDGYTVVLDADIKGFFDNLPHQVIMGAVRERVADGKVLDLLERFLSCGVLEQGKLKATKQGTPQGGVISPLLANIVLNKLDWTLQTAGCRFSRYADDFVVFLKSRLQAEEALTLVNECLATLGLSLSPEKTHITTYGKGYSFLGFEMSSRSRRIRKKSLEKFKDKVRGITVRSHNFELDMIERLNAVIRGTAQYFCTDFATNRREIVHLDSWIRMRLRCMKFKRKSTIDNGRMRNKVLEEVYGLLSLESFYVAAQR